MPRQYSRKLKRTVEKVIGPSISYVPLTRGLFALIDSDDAEQIGRFNWVPTTITRNTVYAQRYPKYSPMHRDVVQGVPKSLYIDHVNGNGLDNRKVNLRVATRSENKRNTGPARHNRLGLKGVSFHNNQYRAVIHTSGKQIFLGHYKTALEAHRVYLAAAKSLHGEFFSGAL